MNLSERAKDLHDRGFSVIATNNKKQPIDAGWREVEGSPNGSFKTAAGVGIVTGREIGGGYLIAIDCDSYDKRLSQAMCEAIAEAAGAPMPYRIGQAPKFLAPIITDQPTHKIQSDRFADGSRVEVLGDGQQFVAYGAHPAGRGGRYHWYNGDMDVERMPRLTLAQVHKLLDLFEGMARDAGLTVTQQGNRGREWDGEEAERQGLGHDELQGLLAELDPEDLPYEGPGWIEVGMAIHHETEGKGFDLWLDWSRRSSKHGEKIGEREMRRKWQSFGRFGGKLVTVATIQHMVAEQGLEGISDADFSVEGDGAEESGLTRLTPFDQLPEITPPSWLVKHMIERDSLIMLYGAAGSGKSYAAITMAYAITQGLPFGPFGVVQAPVVYMYGEGRRGVSYRLNALTMEYGGGAAPSGRLYTSGQVIDLSDARDIQSVGRELWRIKPGLLIIDTLARASGSFDENATGDMNKLVASCDLIREKAGCSVMIVHHTGKKAGAGARGSSVLNAAVDTEIEVQNNGDFMTLVCTKSKDTEPFQDMNFRFKRINFDIQDEDGDPLYSHVIQYDDEAEVVKEKPLSARQQELWDAFCRLWKRGESRVPAPSDLPLDMGMDAPAEGLEESYVKEEFTRGLEEGLARPREVFAKAKSGLVRKAYVVLKDHILVPLRNIV